MSKTTIALEAAVAVVIENRAAEGERQTARQRANVDRAFAQILKLIAPRIRHFIRQYGLVAHWDDAEQCCAIGVHRAIEAYDPTKAQFTTFVNWQLRGELQSLRFRLMTDQRASAKKVEATTVSLNALATGTDGEETSLESVIEDEAAEALTESAASDYLARRATAALIEEYVAHNRKVGLTQLGKRPRPKRAAARDDLPGVPRLRSSLDRLDPIEVEKLDQKLARDREILERRVFDDATLDDIGNGTGITKERIRQISKTATKSMAELAAAHPRFAVMAEYGQPAPLRRKAPTVPVPAAPQVPLLPDPQLEQNQALRVIAIALSATAPSAAAPGWRGNEALLAAGFTYEEPAPETGARPDAPSLNVGNALAA
ncbi:sigma factor-like helix-turn-helix DNA-binding protein [Sphingosinicella terrae]|uniref:sigma factor-like helix-turn-helix DNA-binding protein n=1 Tax=Sphingosinicella terrae TaxID=2172047 RepID=UPI000E0CF989|nr:sigma factor-like helix-turn-helix DNA-binding protein [Sphingosinicella terrae]